MLSKKQNKISVIIGIVLLILLIFNIYTVSSVSGMLGGSRKFSSFSSDVDLSKVDITQLKSTAHSVAKLFPVDKIKTTQDAIDIMIPKGTPDYGEALGVS